MLILIMKMPKSMMMNMYLMIMMIMNVMMLEMSGDDADNHVDWTFDDNDGVDYYRDDSDDSNIGDDGW